MNKTFKVATIGGIQIYIDWSWLLAFAFFTWSLGAYYDSAFPSWGTGTAYLVGAISTILLFVSVLLHELGHSLTARSLGLPVNTITLFIFGGVSSLSQEPASPRIEFLVTIAGPLVSFVLAAVFYLLHVLFAGSSSEVVATLGYLASVNLLLGLFNIIPAYPLDGGRILHAIIWSITGNRNRATRIASTVGQAFGYLLIAGGLVDALLYNDFLGGLWLAFIGWFLASAAGASHQQAMSDQSLRQVQVGTVMDRAPAGVPPTMTVQNLVLEQFLGANRRAVPVEGSDDTLLGLVTIADVRHLAQEDWAATPVGLVMTPAPQLSTVTPRDDLRQAVQLMAEHGYHQLPVVEHDRLVGMLDRDHVVRYLHHGGAMMTGTDGVSPSPGHMSPPTSTPARSGGRAV